MKKETLKKIGTTNIVALGILMSSVPYNAMKSEVIIKTLAQAADSIEKGDLELSESLEDSIATGKVRVEDTVEKYIINPNAKVFNSNKYATGIITAIGQGEVVREISSKDGWSRINYNGMEGYVRSYYLSSTKTERAGYISKSGSSVRKEAKSTASEEFKIEKDTVVKILSSKDSFNEVSFEIDGLVNLADVDKGSNGVYTVKKDWIELKDEDLGTVMAKIKKGTKLEFISVENNVVKVHFTGKGFIPKDNVGEFSYNKVTDTNDQPSRERSTEKAITYKYVYGDSVNFRKSASDSSKVLATLKMGMRVEFVGTSGKWTKVKYDGKTGYMFTKYLVDNKLSEVLRYTTTRVNFRSAPKVSSSTFIKTLDKGTKVEYVATEGDWTKVKCDGKTGYISVKYLQKPVTYADEVTTGNSSNTSTVAEVRYATTRVNFRSEPKESSATLIYTLEKGAKVEYIATEGDWAKVRYNGRTGYIFAKYLSTTAGTTSSSNSSSSNTSSSSTADKVISYGRSLLGKRYVWAATGPNSFDCSGFTQYVFKNAIGKSIPRTSSSQSTVGTKINRNSLKKGDLLFFNTSGKGVSHVGIYTDNNKMIHASSGKGKVVEVELSSYYNTRFVCARRVI